MSKGDLTSKTDVCIGTYEGVKVDVRSKIFKIKKVFPHRKNKISTTFFSLGLLLC